MMVSTNLPYTKVIEACSSYKIEVSWWYQVAVGPILAYAISGWCPTEKFCLKGYGRNWLLVIALRPSQQMSSSVRYTCSTGPLPPNLERWCKRHAMPTRGSTLQQVFHLQSPPHLFVQQRRHGGQSLAIPYWGYSWPGMLLSLMVV